MLVDTAEDEEVVTVAVEAMAAAEVAAVDLEDKEAAEEEEDSVEAVAVPLAAVEAGQCAAVAWDEAVVDHNPTEDLCSSLKLSQMALSPLIYKNPMRH